MKQRVDFADGSYAILREKVNLRGRKAMERTSIPALRAMRRIRAARKAQERGDDDALSTGEQLSYTESEIEAMQRFEMAGCMAMLAHWTREEELPRTIDEMEELDPDDYEVIAKAVRPHLWELMGGPKVGPDDALEPGKPPDLDSPIGPSSDLSADSLRADTVGASTTPPGLSDLPVTPTETSQTSGVSISSEGAIPA